MMIENWSRSLPLFIIMLPMPGGHSTRRLCTARFAAYTSKTASPEVLGNMARGKGFHWCIQQSINAQMGFNFLPVGEH